jgi:hypothetical protein
MKHKKRSKSLRKPVDAIAREHSKRHGEATKQGIKKARKVKHSTQRAVSRGRGKSNAELARRMFASTAAPAAGAPAAAGR